MRKALDREVKQIIKIMLKGDTERQRRIKAGRASDYDMRADKAIRTAGQKLTLPGYAPKQRDELISKLKISLANARPWEEMGETYCSRTSFYAFRKEFRCLIASYMGMVHDG